MKTVFIIVNAWDGHHQTYFKIFTKTILELGYQVIALCPKPDELREWIALTYPSQAEQLYAYEIIQPKLDFYPKTLLRFSPILFRVLMVLAHWRSSGASIQNAVLRTGKSPDLVFFTWLDSYLGTFVTHHLIDKIVPYPWSGLYFQPTHLRKKLKFELIRQGFLSNHGLLQSPNCKSVAILDEGISKKLQVTLKNKPVLIFPDFTDESSPDMSFPMIKEIQEKAKGRKIIGLLGLQDKRKGTFKLLQIALASRKENWFFIFVGKINRLDFSHEEISLIDACISCCPDNCFFHFERIPEESQLNALISICDILFACYNYAHSSNILTKAAIFKKLVITKDEFCMGERVKKFQLGVSVKNDSVVCGIESIRKALEISEKQKHEIFPKLEEYQRIHSTLELKDKLSKLLQFL